MLAAGFVSYVGAFDQDNREFLWRDTWLPDLITRAIPLTEGVDPLKMLSNDAQDAKMISQGLPADRISLENGAVITSCKRWPLLIDPQVQGIKWLRSKEEGSEGGLEVFQLNQKGWQRKIEQALSGGKVVIIENLGEEIDATLDPVLSRAIYKKGRALYLRFGGEEVEYDKNFKLYLQTKLSNPHYMPEIAAQCTLINFIATERGLEDQLLAKVVGKERPELEEASSELQANKQMYKIQLLQLEDDLLERLANAPEDILSDVPLIEGWRPRKLPRARSRRPWRREERQRLILALPVKSTARLPAKAPCYTSCSPSFVPSTTCTSIPWIASSRTSISPSRGQSPTRKLSSASPTSSLACV